MSRTVENPRIGNWYLVDGKPTLTTFGNMIYAIGAYRVPLTGEILQKNGFIHDEKNDSWTYYDDADFIRVSLTELKSNGVRKRSRYINVISVGNDSSIVKYAEEIYVDQLQDLLRVMAVEKEIVL